MSQLSVIDIANRPAPATGYASDLDTPLLMFSERDVWTCRDAAEGVLITGGIGSGKSSSSGALIAKSYLRAGFGGLVLCVNVDEADRWRRYAAETGREQSLIVMDGSLAHRFNFLDYQMTVGRRSAFEAVNVLVEILNAAEGKVETGGDGKDAFWDSAMREVLGKTLTPLWAAYGRITLATMMRFIHSRPRREEQLADPQFLNASFWGQTMQLALTGGTFPLDEDEYRPLFDYWTVVMTNPDQKTAGNIIQTVTARLDPFLSGDLRQLFCTTSTFVPELTFEGAVIVLDLSAHDWGKEGLLSQHIIKLMWQKAMQRRPKTPDARPCFLFADEAQYFLAASDQAFASTSRACKALTVYLTQNLPGVYAKLGGSSAHDVADALLGNLATKVFHAQPDTRTAQWAAEMIGKGVVWRRNVGVGQNESSGSNTSQSTNSGGSGPATSSSATGYQTGRGSSMSEGASEVVDYHLQPSHFVTLKKGGGADRQSEAVIFQAGRRFEHTQATWMPVLFRQG